MSDDPDDAGLAVLDPDKGEGSAAGPHRRRRTGVLILVGILAIFLIVPVAAVALYAVTVERTFNSNVHREPSLTIPSDDARPEKPSEGTPGAGSMNFLLIGSDDRGDGNGGRSDALMLLHLNSDRDRAYIISFPRDLYVEIPGFGKNKINAAYAFGGPVLSARTVENLLDVRIDHLAQIDMAGFINLTEQLGGVKVHNKYATHYGEYDFPAGEITLSGKQALTYVRQRSQLPRGDLDRAERQRQVTQAIIRKGLSRETISNPKKFNAFVSAVARNVTVDEDLSQSAIRKLALSLRMSPEDVQMLEVPTNGTGAAGSMSIVVPDNDGIAKLATHIREDTMADYHP